MAQKHSFLLLIPLFMVSCSSIPSKSIMEPLETNELAKIIKNDTMFERFYTMVSKTVENLSDIDKAKYTEITYSSFYDCYKFMNDSTQTKPLTKEFETEWNNKYAQYDNKVDSVMDYWKKYIEDNSLSRFVTIEFDRLSKEYYSYSHDVKNVNFGFKLTPKDGAKIEQIKFNYRYSAKINDYRGEQHRCISTSPFSSPVVWYWECDYSDEKRLKGVSSEEFKRDYNIEFEVTDIRKDGKNYSIDDLNVPKSVKNYMDTTFALSSLYKEDVIKETIYPEYIAKSDYVYNHIKEEISKRYPKEYEFIFKRNK
ncbi:MAG: hypothetical protein IKO56_08595 [Alphaproteobacteria bacterium]|nr:hypothetical protein [Alphaproteobacteria bacterium]